ncbi:predicted protein [Botrytis cinerea T4]|uniref:Uncharacterized protein n=1 Tax=Botryotinia fuckeliana (strain T4) TaxID=999810 RepID=G2XP43_BOTF4|nr:predicted protein [Botrytis cinerea T4]
MCRPYQTAEQILRRNKRRRATDASRDSSSTPLAPQLEQNPKPEHIRLMGALLFMVPSSINPRITYDQLEKFCSNYLFT